MVFDSVREELALKISPIIKPLKVELPLKSEVKEKPAPAAMATPVVKPMPPMAAPISAPVKAEVPIPKNEVVAASAPTPPVIKTETAEITAKPTSPTLVEFQNKNAVLPDWRLQMQNAVRRRQSDPSSIAPMPAQPRTMLVTSGATALQAEVIPEPIPESVNSTLSNALKRIEQSRQKFQAEEKPAETISASVQTAPRSFPYAVPNKAPEFAVKKAEPNPNAFQAKSKAAPVLTEVKPPKFDTNKLPPLAPRAKSTIEIDEIPTQTKIVEPVEIEIEDQYLHIKAEATPTDVMAYNETTIDEFVDEEADDRAPLGMRFNAGLFDLIVGAAISAVLLAPFMLTNETLLTFPTMLAFLATCSIVMFIYLTTTIGTSGRTLGMRLFSLEVVDIEQNAYPTFHQAAVSSSVYLVSLALGGAGYLTMFLNDEKRAAHDLASGTIIVKEYE